MKPFDETGEFRPLAGGEGLRRAAVRGAGVMIFFSALVTAVQLFATVVLARLLVPADFGLVAMATTFSLLFVNFGLNGFTEAIVQREHLTEGLASNLFWINLGCGVLFTIGFAASGPLLARFFGRPNLVPVTAAVALTILLTSVSVLHLALLRRAMRFTAVSVNDLLGRCVSVAVSIGCGFAGWGYWALVAGLVAQPVCVSVGAFLRCRWVPRPPARVAGTGSMVRFAINVYGFFGLNYVKGNMDNLLVGWSFGPSVLGLYKKAYDLFSIAGTQLLSPISGAAVPALCRMANDPQRQRGYLLKSFSILAFVGMGLGGIFTIVGQDIIVALLGAKWVAAGKIFTLFGPGIGAMFLYGPWGWIPLSIGRAERYSRWGGVEVTVTGLLFVIGLHWGPEGVAVAWSVSFWLLAIPATWYAGRPIGFSVGPVIAVVWRYILASVLAGCGCSLIMPQVAALVVMPGIAGNILRIVTNSVVFGFLYLALVVILHHGWEPLQQIARLLTELAPRTVAKTSPVPAGGAVET